MPERKHSRSYPGQRLKYRGSGPTGFIVRVEQRDLIDVLYYRGVHDCGDGDHQYDKQVHEYLVSRINSGRLRFLVDVRRLEVRFGSGVGDLLEAWKPARAVGGVRLAILWDPAPPKSDRRSLWQFLRWCASFPKGSRSYPFSDEREALEALCYTDEKPTRS